MQASYKFIDDKCGDQLSYHQYADTSIIELWGQCNSASSVPIEGESHIKKVTGNVNRHHEFTYAEVQAEY